MPEYAGIGKIQSPAETKRDFLPHSKYVQKLALARKGE